MDVKIVPLQKRSDQSVFSKNWTDYVYVLVASHGCWLAKVGVSNDPMRRVKELSTASAIPFVELWLSQVDGRSSAFRLEQTLHTKLRKFHKRGEWFRVGRSVEEFVGKCELIRGAADIRSTRFLRCTGLDQAFGADTFWIGRSKLKTIRSEIAAERAEREVA